MFQPSYSGLQSYKMRFRFSGYSRKSIPTLYIIQAACFPRTLDTGSPTRERHFIMDDTNQSLPAAFAPEMGPYLSRIPPELRNMIYKHAFLNQPSAALQIRRKGSNLSHPAIGLTRTCQAVRRETLRLFYASTTLLISIEQSLPSTTIVAALESWRDLMDDICRGDWLIRRVEVEVWSLLEME